MMICAFCLSTREQNCLPNTRQGEVYRTVDGSRSNDRHGIRVSRKITIKEWAKNGRRWDS